MEHGQFLEAESEEQKSLAMSQPVNGGPPGAFPRAEAILAGYLRDIGEGPDAESVARDLLRMAPLNMIEEDMNDPTYVRRLIQDKVRIWDIPNDLGASVQMGGEAAMEDKPRMPVESIQ